MSDQNEANDDLELRGIAMGAFHEHESTVSRQETEAALGAVRSRAAAGDMGGSSPVLLTDERRRRRSPGILFGAAAAVVGMIALGLVAVTGGTGTDRVNPPATLPPVVDSTFPEPVPATTVAEPPVTTLAPDPAPDMTDGAATTVAPTPTSPPSTTLTPATDSSANTPPTTMPVVVAPADPVDAQNLAIPDNCDGDFCTGLALTEDGRLVAYDPTTDTLDVYDSAGQVRQSTVTLVESSSLLRPFLVHVGPDDVAYLTVDPAVTSDGIRDLIAVPLAGPNAGAEVMRWEGLDGSGDSSLVARKAGLTSVGCCGPRVPRPDPDAPLFRYVDRSGDIVVSTAPTFRLDLGDAGSNLVRIEEDGSSTFFALPSVFQSPRDMPQVVATSDGGALALDFVQTAAGGRSYLVRFRTDWPEFGIDNSDVILLDESVFPELLEPADTVILSDGEGAFVRRSFSDAGTPGWPGRAEVSLENELVTADGLNDYITANQPAWAADGSTFGLQFEQSIGANESVRIEFDEATGVLTVTTSGFLDDSVAAVRRTIQTERADDGLLRFVSGTYGQQCQPGRGQQDFTGDFCI